jgi:hypothetical protein
VYVLIGIRTLWKQFNYENQSAQSNLKIDHTKRLLAGYTTDKDYYCQRCDLAISVELAIPVVQCRQQTYMRRINWVGNNSDVYALYYLDMYPENFIIVYSSILKYNSAEPYIPPS